MTHINDQADTNLKLNPRRRSTDSPWLWFLITGGSVLAHLCFIYWVGASTLQARLGSVSENVTPVDFVELPASDPAESVKLVAPKSAVASTSQPAPKAAKAAPPAQPAIDSNQIQLGAVPATPPPKAAVREQSEAIPSASPSVKPQAATPQTPPDAVMPPPVTAARSPSTSDDPSTSPSPVNDTILPPTTSSPSPSPLIVTEAINVPVPDVSGSLPLPQEEGNNLSAIVTNRVTIPSHLTASLTTASVPLEDPIELDEAARPKTIVQRFSSNPTVSPCKVTPEAVQFLGKTVAMQVITNETGQVIDTVTHESSQSSEYDDLATCLVENWSFEPAIARGEPVMNDGLIVRITIDRS